MIETYRTFKMYSCIVEVKQLKNCKNSQDINSPASATLEGAANALTIFISIQFLKIEGRHHLV